ncbi:MAG: hypothetical protein ACRDSI_02065 [Pseudonocardiaceae bacterium]
MDYLTTRERERADARQVATFGVFGPPDAVACVTDFPPQLETRGGKAIILAAGKKITVPADALADALIGEGICAEVTPDFAEGYADMLTPKTRVSIAGSG